MCVPICPSWRQDSKGVSLLLDVVVVMTHSIGFITSVVILVISAFRYKSM